MSYREKWRKTLKGFTSYAYDQVVSRNRRRGLGRPTFSLEDFRRWFYKAGGIEKYQIWVEADFIRETKPSIDRINPLKGYTFDNMQILTVPENIQKGHVEKELFWGKRTKQFSSDGQVIATYPSVKVAGKLLNIDPELIGQAARRHHRCAGYMWEYEEDIKHRTRLALQLHELKKGGIK